MDRKKLILAAIIVLAIAASAVGIFLAIHFTGAHDHNDNNTDRVEPVSTESNNHLDLNF
jgi:flagellar basal body-associated protein FliL